MMSFRRLLQEITLPWPALTAAVISGAITVWANVGMLATAAYLISLAALHPPLVAVTLAVTGVRFFTLVRAGFRYLERYIAHDAAFRLVSRIRLWFYKRVEPRVPGGLCGIGTTGLWHRAVADVETLQFFFLRVLLPPGVAVLVGATVGLALCFAGISFAMVFMLGFIAAGVALPFLLRKLGRGTGAAILQARSELRAFLADSVLGLRDLWASNQQEEHLEKIRTAEQAYAMAQGRAAHVSGLGDAGGQLVMHGTVLVVVITAIPLIRAGALDGVWLAALALAVQGAFEAALPLAQTLHFGEESIAAAGRLLEVGEGKPAADEERGLKEVPQHFSLVAENLYFRYPSAERWGLENIAFSIPQGSRIAIVGESGAGKSTLAVLMLRFWDYQGSIRLANRELTDYSPATVRNIIGLVPQQIHIFNASLADNIRVADPRADMAKVREAAIQAGLESVINSLPQGLNTFLGVNGHGLSGGERQRLAIARVLLQQPEIVILDEPAASLDTATEQAVMSGVRKWLSGRTIIVITHRLSGLEDMDEILVLDAGRLVERGKYTELIARRGLFYKMWQYQQDIIE